MRKSNVLRIFAVDFLINNTILSNMAKYLVKDCNPQFQGENYYVGKRPMVDASGRQCLAADFGPRQAAHRFNSADEANKFAREMNSIAGNNFFKVIEDEGMAYGLHYGAPSRSMQTNGFVGYDGLPPQRR